jgi:hypothetical protein
MFISIIYLAIKDILRTRAADFVDSAYSGEVFFIDMLQDLSQNINGDRKHGGYLCRDGDIEEWALTVQSLIKKKSHNVTTPLNDLGFNVAW